MYNKMSHLQNPYLRVYNQPWHLQRTMYTGSSIITIDLALNILALVQTCDNPRGGGGGGGVMRGF